MVAKQKPFIVTVVGAESSGKTTLVRQLAHQFGCPWVPEYAREYLSGLGRPYEEGDLTIMAEHQLESILEAIRRNMPPSPLKGEDDLHFPPGHFPPSPLKGEGNLHLPTGHLPPGPLKGGDDLHLPPSPLKGEGNLHLPTGSSNEKERDIKNVLIVDGGMLTLQIWARIKYGLTIPLVEQAMAEDMTTLYILCRPTIPWEVDPLREAPRLLDRVWIYNHYLNELSHSGKPFISLDISRLDITRLYHELQSFNLRAD